MRCTRWRRTLRSPLTRRLSWSWATRLTASQVHARAWPASLSYYLVPCTLIRARQAPVSGLQARCQVHTALCNLMGACVVPQVIKEIRAERRG